MSRSLLSKELRKMGFHDQPIDTTDDLVPTSQMGRAYHYIPAEGPYDEYELYIVVKAYTRTEAAVEAYLKRTRSEAYMQIVTTRLRHCDTDQVLSEVDRIKAALELSLLVMLVDEE